MTKSNVVIDGVKYVPVDKNSISIKKVSKVLKGQGYLSDNAIRDILKQLRTPTRTKTKKVVQKKKKQWDDSIKYSAPQKVLFSISGVLSNGGVLYKNRKSPAKWNIQQAIIIRKAMNDDSSKGMTNRDIRDLAKKTKLHNNMVRKIMYNIEYGDLGKEIEKWKFKNLQYPLKVNKPVQNNPQKRRESGLYV